MVRTAITRFQVPHNLQVAEHPDVSSAGTLSVYLHGTLSVYLQNALEQKCDAAVVPNWWSLLATQFQPYYVCS